MEADLAKSFAREYERGRDQLSARLREMIEAGQRVLAVDYNRALERAATLNAALDELFTQLRRDPDAGGAGGSAQRSGLDR